MSNEGYFPSDQELSDLEQGVNWNDPLGLGKLPPSLNDPNYLDKLRAQGIEPDAIDRILSYGHQQGWFGDTPSFTDALRRGSLVGLGLPKSAVDIGLSELTGQNEIKPVEEKFSNWLVPKDGPRREFSLFRNPDFPSATPEAGFISPEQEQLENAIVRSGTRVATRFAADPLTYTGLGLAGKPGVVASTLLGAEASRGAGEALGRGSVAYEAGNTPEATEALIEALASIGMGAAGFRHGLKEGSELPVTKTNPEIVWSRPESSFESTSKPVDPIRVDEANRAREEMDESYLDPKKNPIESGDDLPPMPDVETYRRLLGGTREPNSEYTPEVPLPPVKQINTRSEYNSARAELAGIDKEIANFNESTPREVHLDKNDPRLVRATELDRQIYDYENRFPPVEPISIKGELADAANFVKPSIGGKEAQLGVFDPTGKSIEEAKAADAKSKLDQAIESGQGTFKPVLSEPAKVLVDLLKAGKMTRFNQATVIQGFEKAGIPLSDDLKSMLPGVLDELKANGNIRELLGGTYTLQSGAPKRYSVPEVTPETGPSLEDQLKASIENHPDIQALKDEIMAKPVSAMSGEEVAPPTPKTQAGQVPPNQPPTNRPPGTITPKPKIPKYLNTKSESDPSEASLLEDLTDLPKTLKSSFDISFPGRQGLFLLNRPEGLKGVLKGTAGGLSEKLHLANEADLNSRPNSELYKKFGLNQVKYDPTEPSSLSEQFPVFKGEQGSKFGQAIQKIPGLKQSERMFNDAGNLMRANVFDSLTEKWSKAGKTPETRPDLYYGLSKYLNVLTGRDPLPVKLQKAGYILNKAFWSPQFVKSRMQMLNPVFYAQLPREVQLEAIRDVGGTISTMALIASATAYALRQQGVDAKFETEPTHTNFGKLVVGKSKYDLFSSLGPMVRTAARIAESKKTTPSGTYKLQGGFGLGNTEGLPPAPMGQSAGSELGNFVENKAAPAYQIGKGVLTGKNYYGEPYDIPSFLDDLATPMSIGGIIQAWHDYDAEEGAKNIPDLFGISTQTEHVKRDAEGNIVVPKAKVSKGKKTAKVYRF